MELLLTHEDMWEYVTVMPNSEDANSMKRDRQAKICLMVNPDLLVPVRQAKTTKETWEILIKTFEDKVVNNRCKLLGKLVSLKLEQFDNLREHVTEILRVAQQLPDIGR